MQLAKEEPAMRFTQYLIRGIVFTISSPGDNGILIFEIHICMYLLVTVYFRVDLIKRLLIFLLNIYLKWTPQHLTGDSSTLIQVVAWCFYAPNHSPGQCLQSVYNENRTLRKNFSEILIKTDTFSFKKVHLKRSSANGGHFVSATMC